MCNELGCRDCSSICENSECSYCQSPDEIDKKINKVLEGVKHE